MTGKGILEALGFVDDKYIEEAENGTIRSHVSPFVKLLPLAACLCVALLGLWPKAQTETVPQQEDLSETQRQDSGTEPVIVDNEHQEEDPLNSDFELAMDEVEEPCVSEAPSLILRITEWHENGFTATVERHVDSEVFPLGETVQVEFLPNACIEIFAGETVTVKRTMPTDADFPAGTLVKIRYTSISVEIDVIRAEAISLAVDE